MLHIVNIVLHFEKNDVRFLFSWISYPGEIIYAVTKKLKSCQQSSYFNWI